jgi:feruloyl esterase
MTIEAKAIVAAHYGTAPRVSYWNGCSTGGRQGLKEAQRYPTDYDGIIAGAPTNDQAHLAAYALSVARAAKDRARAIPRDKFAVLHQAALDACDALDGVKDGVLEDPTRCRFDPSVLECHGEDTAACLTPAQVETARAIYAPLTNPRTGAEIFPGLERGSEQGWGFLAGGPAVAVAADHFKYIVFKNPSWNYETLDFDKDLAVADAAENAAINATDPNLLSYVERGGKLLMFHGWSDASVSPRSSTSYYTRVVSTLGAGRAADSIRLFMVPGMAHCGGGDGATSFDPLAALDQWVEQKRPPERIAASRLANGAVDRTRPLCPYPQVAEYAGTGSTDDIANFICAKR